MATNLLNIETRLNNIDQTLSQIQNLGNQLVTTANNAQTGTNNLEKFAGAVVATGFALKQVIDVAVDTTIKMDRMNSQMEAASGGAFKAAQNLDYIRTISEKMGTNILVTSDSFARLTAAARGTALEGENTRKIFEAVTAANTRLGGSTSDLEGMLQALSQMISKGTVSMEELRGQLGERLPGAMGMAAEAMGVTTSELIKMVSEGQVLAEDLLPKLAEKINTTFNDGKFDTAQANVNRLTNEWIIFKQSIVDSQAVNDAIKVTTTLLRNARAEAAFMKEIYSGSYLTKPDRAGEAAARVLFDVEKDPRIEAFKKYRVEQQKYLQAQKEIQDIESRPRKMGDTSRAEDLTKAQTKLESLIPTYTNAANELAKFEKEARKANEQKNALANLPPAYVTETKGFVLDKEVDKIKKFNEQMKNELDMNKKQYETYIKQYENNAEMKLKVTEAYHQRETAITAEYNDKIAKEQKKLDAPGIRAAKADEREAAKKQREFESMVERSRDVIAQLQNDYMTQTGKTYTNELQKIDEVAKAQKQAEQDKVINAKLWGQEAAAAQEELAKTIKAIDERAAADKIKLQKETNDKVTKYLNDLQLDTTKLAGDKISELKLTQEAELKILQDRYNKEIEMARRAGISTANIENLYNQRVAAQQKKNAEDTTRISGGYLEKLSLKIKDSYGDNTNFVNKFNDDMANTTIMATERMADSLVEMAANGKTTFKDFAYSVIIDIEKMIAKMLILWGVQKLVGLVASSVGSVGTIDQFGATDTGKIVPGGISEKGNAFDSGSVIPFANGGIVNRMTKFPMKTGTGMMGEAGPEAILPLARDSTGRLGVYNSTKNTNNTSTGVTVGAINVTVQGGKNPQETGNQVSTAVVRQLKQLIQEEVKNGFRPGNSLNPTKTIGGATKFA